MRCVKCCFPRAQLTTRPRLVQKKGCGRRPRQPAYEHCWRAEAAWRRGKDYREGASRRNSKTLRNRKVRPNEFRGSAAHCTAKRPRVTRMKIAQNCRGSNLIMIG